MFYPALTRFNCADCQQFVYDVEWSHGCRGSGQRKKYCGGTKDFVRPAGSPPPCSDCPKESPAKEHEHVLTADNWLTWQLWREVRASGGACLTDSMRADRVLLENLSLIDDLARIQDRRQLAREIAVNLIR